MDDKIFDLLEKTYEEMQDGFEVVNVKIDGVENKLEETKDRVIIIEQERGKKLDVLFDGYKQNGDKLDRIEKEVSKHEEIILRRVK